MMVDGQLLSCDHGVVFVLFSRLSASKEEMDVVGGRTFELFLDSLSLSLPSVDLTESPNSHELNLLPFLPFELPARASSTGASRPLGSCIYSDSR